MAELRQLRAFVAVAEELSFTRAAERLYLGQQAVSKSVSRLERELGVELLERTTREVRLTAAGAALLSTGREALASVEAALADARNIGRGLEGTVKVGVTPAIGPIERTRVAHSLRDGSEDVVVSLIDVRPAQIQQLLRDRALDLVLARTGDAPTGVHAAELAPTPAMLHVSKDHPLAAARSVSLSQLDRARLLTWNPPGTPYTDLLIDRLAAAGATVEPVQARIRGAVSPALTDTGTVALMPTGWPPADGIVQLPLDEDVTLPLHLLWPAGRPSHAIQRVQGHMATPPA